MNYHIHTMVSNAEYERIKEFVRLKSESLGAYEVPFDWASELLSEWTEDKFEEFEAWVTYGEDFQILGIVLKRGFSEQMEFQGKTYNVYFTYDGEDIRADVPEEPGDCYESDDDFGDNEDIYVGRLDFDDEGLVVGGIEAIERMRRSEESARNLATHKANLARLAKIDEDLIPLRKKLREVELKVEKLLLERSQLEALGVKGESEDEEDCDLPF